MKCPKCGYLGFEQVERCRNCGYDFSLSSASTLPDLSLRTGRAQDSEGPLEDFTLLKGSFDRSARDAAGESRTATARRTARAGATPELPLFGSPDGDDLPLVSKPSVPRTPLAVRRATPEVPRLRGSARATMFDVAALESDVLPRPVPAPARPMDAPVPAPSVTRPLVPATILSRVAAAAIDLVVVAGIDAAVLYFTLRIAGLTVNEITVLPPIPMAAFLVAQNLAYFVAFTTGGQTLGQMALSIRVTSTDDGAAPDLRQSIVRTLIWILLLLPAGLGLLTVLFGDEGRGLHDRVAGTRVVGIPGSIDA